MLIQRVSEASCRVDGECVGSIAAGLLVLFGVGQGDTKDSADRLTDKLANLRIFPDEGGKMNRSLLDISGELLIISQFTLYADCRRGRRPAFTDAAAPDIARELYQYVIDRCRFLGIPVQTGIFAADMKISLINDGPVTILLDSQDFE